MFDKQLATTNIHSDRVRAFVDAYCIDLDEKKAAKASGYSHGAARAFATACLTDPAVRAMIQARLDAKAIRNAISADSVLADIELVKRDAMQTYYNEKTGLTEMASRQDALKALEQLGRHLVLFTDKTQIDATVTVNILSFDDSQAQGVTIEATKQHESASGSDSEEIDTNTAETIKIEYSEAEAVSVVIDQDY